MIRKLIAIAVSILLLTGCGEDPQPTRREAPDQPVATLPSPATPDPHANMSLPMASGPEVSLGSMVLTAPDGWNRKQPKSPRITFAEFGLPHAEGDTADGRLTVTQVGGTVEANMEYWKDQFGGLPTHESQETVDIADTQVVLIDLRGTFKDQHQMQPSGVEQPGHRVRAAIFKVAGVQFVVKCAGPEKTILEREDEFMAFINSLRPRQAGAAE